MKTMVPKNIIKKWGVYPFNPDSIVTGTTGGISDNATTGGTTSGDAGDSDGGLSGMGLDEDNSEGGVFDFILEEEVRFERRYEEGYDLYEPHYSASS